MRSATFRHSLAIVTLVIAAASAPTIVCAQVAAPSDSRPIEQRMTSDQFKAAGLSWLSPAELANLNQWLYGTLREVTAKVSADATANAKKKAQGFFDVDGKRESIMTSIAGSFEGFGPGRVFLMANGQKWQQEDDTTLFGHKDSPQVELRPGMMNVWWLLINGYNTRAKVRRIE